MNEVNYINPINEHRSQIGVDDYILIVLVSALNPTLHNASGIYPIESPKFE